MMKTWYTSSVAFLIGWNSSSVMSSNDIAATGSEEKMYQGNDVSHVDAENKCIVLHRMGLTSGTADGSNDSGICSAAVARGECDG
jgi:hypothetical protein